MQGATEVVPVSSSAHLALLPWLLRWDAPADRTALAAGLHAGSCAGLAYALRGDLRTLGPPDLLVLAAASVPAAAAGLLAGDVVEKRLGGPRTTAALLAAAGLLLGAADRARQDRPLDLPAAAAAGLAQLLALAPGVSRSGATLTALRALGVGREPALRFSLLLSLPVTAGAAGLSLLRARDARAALARPLLVGAPTAAVVSAVTSRALLGRTDRLLSGAVAYRLGLAATVAVVAWWRTPP